MDEAAMNVLRITAVCFAFVSMTNARNSAPELYYPDGGWSQPVQYIKEPTEVKCQASATPPAKYYWTFNGTRIIPDEATVSFDESTGTLTAGKDFGKKHSGDYQCFAYNDVGTSMTPIIQILAAHDAPFQGKQDVETVRVYVSKYIEIECQNVPNSLPWWTFKWMFNPVEPDSFQNLEIDKRRMIVDAKGSLHLLWAEKSDRGYYACAVTNDVFLSTYRNTHVTSLNVLDGVEDERGPELKYSQDLQVYAKGTAHLLCIFSYFSRSDVMQVNWLFNGEKAGTGPNITLVNVKSPNATHQNEEGQYRCEAKLGTKEDDGTVNLKIVSPPTPVKGDWLERKSVPVEKDAVFRCGTYSHNTYSVPPVWLVNGKPLIGCPERYFECKQTLGDGYSNCIPEKSGSGNSVVCNNDPDCADNSDEANCLFLICPEAQVQCRDKCGPNSTLCEELPCNFPNATCSDGLRCITPDLRCNKHSDCRDGSDELVCEGRNDIKRGRFYISSDRKQLTLPSVSLSDSMCFQCIVRNEYGTTIGDGCLTVIDKIVVLKGPNSTYDVEPDTRIEIIVEAQTDSEYQQHMNYTWWWYQKVEDKKTGEKLTVPQELPPEGSQAIKSFYVSKKNMTIVFPPVKDGDDKSFDIYSELIDRVYTLIVKHRFDRVELNFTINGKEIVKPVPIVEAASTNLWFIALILGILLLFIVVALIVCYMYRNRGGTYLLDKKEHKAGHDPEQELKDGGFQDVGRVDDYDSPHADKVSLSESVRPYESDDDPTEEYGADFDASKFNEEGSFIGAYGEKTKEATV